MTTRAEINEKYGIVRLMSPAVANKELSEEEAKEYEKMTKIHCEIAKQVFDRTPKEERLIELVKLYASDLTDKQLEHSLAFFEKLDKELNI